VATGPGLVDRRNAGASAAGLFDQNHRATAPAKCTTPSTCTAMDCINDCNALLKRLWVHVDGASHVAALSGDAWLAYLDKRSASLQFTEGPGRLLGNQRFSSISDDSQLPALQPLLRKLLKSAPVTT
jgi:Domain of unknown function (DUF4381)